MSPPMKKFLGANSSALLHDARGILEHIDVMFLGIPAMQPVN